MRAIEVDVLVVGGGPAGLHAAYEARRSCRDVAVVDEYATPGGQYYRRPALVVPGRPRRAEMRGRSLAKNLEAAGVLLLLDTVVFNIERADQRRFLVFASRGGTAAHFYASTVVVATGGYDRVIPFPGWTLPGVLTAGGMQTVAKVLHATPGRRIVIAGSGPFLLPVTKTVIETGGTVAGVLEATTPMHIGRRVLPALVHVNRCLEALSYRYVLARSGVRIQFGRRVVEARGEDRVEEIITAAVDRDWRPIPGTEATIATDLVAIGYGFQPATQLTRLLGCEEVFMNAAGGWCPRTDRTQMTSIPGLFVAGETGGIGGAHLAEATGKIAGRSAAAVAVRGNDRDHPYSRSLAMRRRWNQHFADTINMAFRMSTSIYADIPCDTVVCRCEDVLAKDIHAAAALQADVSFVKGVTRAGMGPCQGRTCLHTISGMLSGASDPTVNDSQSFTPRFPIKPVPLNVLARRPDDDQAAL